MDKVKLTKNQAKALEIAMRIYKPVKILLQHGNDPNNWLDEVSALGTLDFDTLVKAIYIGYDVELSPQEKLSSKYEVVKSLIANEKDKENKSYFEGVKDGIEIAVKLLELKIEGINH